MRLNETLVSETLAAAAVWENHQQTNVSSVPSSFWGSGLLSHFKGFNKTLLTQLGLNHFDKTSVIWFLEIRVRTKTCQGQQINVDVHTAFQMDGWKKQVIGDGTRPGHMRTGHFNQVYLQPEYTVTQFQHQSVNFCPAPGQMLSVYRSEVWMRCLELWESCPLCSVFILS